EPTADRFGRSGDADRVEHLVGDAAAHLEPLPFLREAVQLGLEVAPAVVLEEDAVGRRRSVEGDLRLRLRTRARDLLLAPPEHDDRLAGDLDRVARPSRAGETLVEGGQRHLLDELRRVERMD